ncbi:phosphotransferase enzyme family protein [Trichoderma reesei RUT C-30]|uniref:Phosphotransferase enzyme family protein n=2 Tax=Hypocrea jecorina TaxID=51453 RepID=A0A024SET1_HYPJR|nr:phosphotransferase enzyme family protein [Trichoderma reesei RUT C-30]
MDRYPPTGEQLEERIVEFIDSIVDSAVCRLASKYNGQKPCSIVGSSRGSFNVCFFVQFGEENAKWVVRVPLEPVVVDPWAKVQSEAATMRYIKKKTTIPIPAVHAYGNDADLIQGESKPVAFLICDYIPGQSLGMRTFADATADQRKHFYNDLFDILSQLYGLEFPVAGSLMPNPGNDAEPIIGPIQCMAANELHRVVQPQRNPSTFSSYSDYMTYQLHILSETFRLPTEELDSNQAKMELFAIESLAKQAPTLFDTSKSEMPFVLAHQDMRCSNVIVTEDFHISGIIDWEFSGTIPRQLFTPPPWISGHDLDVVIAYPARAPITLTEIRSEFLQTLATKSATSRNCAQLMETWKHQSEQLFPVSQILRQPSCLISVYNRFLFPRTLRAVRKDVVDQFFTSDGEGRSLAPEVSRRVEQSENYTQYLKDQGLFVPDNQSQLDQEWLTKAEALLNSLK